MSTSIRNSERLDRAGLQVRVLFGISCTKSYIVYKIYIRKLRNSNFCCKIILKIEHFPDIVWHKSLSIKKHIK